MSHFTNTSQKAIYPVIAQRPIRIATYGPILSIRWIGLPELEVCALLGKSTMAILDSSSAVVLQYQISLFFQL